jgi:FMN phosphatase YigB (HAD superfamily)
VVVLDLDDTLVPERAAAPEAVARTLTGVGAEATPSAVQRVFDVARARWQAGPYYEPLRDLGVSSWEALWADFEGSAVPEGAIAWGAEFRTSVWAEAGSGLARGEDAARLFVRHRRGLVRPFPGVRAALERLGSGHELWVATNGASRLQRLKLRLSGLEDCFARVFVSGEVGVAKPGDGFFAALVEALGDDRAVCALVGDSLRADIGPAVVRGWPAVHVCGEDGEACADGGGERGMARGAGAFPKLEGQPGAVAHVASVGDAALMCAHG